MTDLEEYYLDRLISEYNRLVEVENLVTIQEANVSALENQITRLFGEKKAEEMYDKYKKCKEKIITEEERKYIANDVLVVKEVLETRRVQMEEKIINEITCVMRASNEVEQAKEKVTNLEQTLNEIRNEFKKKYGLNALSAIDILTKRINDNLRKELEKK